MNFKQVFDLTLLVMTIISIIFSIYNDNFPALCGWVCSLVLLIEIMKGGNQ